MPIRSWRVPPSFPIVDLQIMPLHGPVQFRAFGRLTSMPGALYVESKDAETTAPDVPHKRPYRVQWRGGRGIDDHTSWYDVVRDASHEPRFRHVIQRKLWG